jgi:capsular polysaccharide biosynthesis protein
MANLKTDAFGADMRSAFPFFWQPKGVVASLENLPAADDVLQKSDVTLAVSGNQSSSHPLMVAALAGGKIIGDLRLAATRDDVVIGGLQTVFGCASLNGHYALKRRRFRLPKFRRGTALLLGAANSDNYYHWLLDSLPRWKILQAAGWRDYDFVLLHSQPRRFQDETLDWLGVPAAKRLRCSKNFIHQFERLVVPAMPFPLEEVSAWACAWLRSLVPQKSSGPEKVFLSRRGVGGRQLANEAVLQAALESRGFVAIQPEKLSVAEQAQFLGSARCVVAPHGAALTNLVFAPPGALLVELFHPQHKNRCYVNLAAACGHRYASLDGRAIEHAEAKRLEYTVEVSVVLQTIAENS